MIAQLVIDLPDPDLSDDRERFAHVDAERQAVNRAHKTFVGAEYVLEVGIGRRTGGAESSQPVASQELIANQGFR